MTQADLEWYVAGNCVEGCTSPPVCPAYWNSPLPAQLHDGHSQCEGVWTFSITEGRYRDIDLAGFLVSFGFNSPSPFPGEEGSPWRCVIYIGDDASAPQAEALEEVFRTCWGVMGDVIAVKRAGIQFDMQLVDGGQAARHEVGITGTYQFVSRPFRTTDNRPRYINSLWGGHINIGISEVNQFDDSSLPRGRWNAPGMSVTYYRFHLNPDKRHWLP